MYEREDYLSKQEIHEIHQHIQDIYNDDYLLPSEHAQLFNQIMDAYIHEDDDALFIYKED